MAVVVCRGSRRIAAGSSRECGAGCESCSCRVQGQPSVAAERGTIFRGPRRDAAAFWRQDPPVRGLVGRVGAALGRIPDACCLACKSTISGLAHFCLPSLGQGAAPLAALPLQGMAAAQAMLRAASVVLLCWRTVPTGATYILESGRCYAWDQASSVTMCDNGRTSGCQYAWSRGGQSPDECRSYCRSGSGSLSAFAAEITASGGCECKRRVESNQREGFRETKHERAIRAQA